MTEFVLGTLDGLTFNLLVELEESEFDALNRAITSVERLQSPFHYKLVERNFLTLSDTLQLITTTMSAGRSFGEPNHRQLGETVMIAAANFLSAFRLFLDHEETDLKRSWGKGSQQILRFKAVTASAYDEHIGYRFAYKFRNYVQHCGLPLSRIAIAGRSQSDVQLVNFVLNRDSLISEYDGWGSVRNDLKDMEETIELFPLLLDAMEGLRKVNRECIDIDIDAAIVHAGLLVSAISRLGGQSSPTALPAIFLIEELADGRTNISPRLFSTDAVRMLVGIGDGTEGRAEFYSGPTEPSTLANSLSIQQVLRQNRGVEVLLSWMAEGGATPAFEATVNEILRADGDVEPLISGLVSLSGVLAHLAAMALGTTAPSLIANLDQVLGGQSAGVSAHDSTPKASPRIVADSQEVRE